ncbi:hypothetical protein D3C87_878770 [compost metagenome]
MHADAHVQPLVTVDQIITTAAFDDVATAAAKDDVASVEERDRGLCDRPKRRIQ